MGMESLAAASPALLAQMVDQPMQYVSSAEGMPVDGHHLFGHKATFQAACFRAGFPVPYFVGLDQRLVTALPFSADLRQAFGRSLMDVVLPLETRTGKSFSDPSSPLIVSVRGGASRVIEGLLPTLQGVGLNSATVVAIGEKFQDPVGAYRRYLRFIIDFGCIVRGIPRRIFSPVDLTASSLRDLRKQIVMAQSLITGDQGLPFPEDPWCQLQEACLAISRAWDAPHVAAYRRERQIPRYPGAGIMIQDQVFGDIGENSAAGTFFSRNARTGEPGRWGEVKIKANGDDVMTGSAVDPLPLARLFLLMPHLSGPFDGLIGDAESLMRSPVKGEFTIEQGVLHLLQVVRPPLWAFAILRSAVDLHEEGKIAREEMTGLVGPKVWSDLGSRRYERPQTADAFLLMGKSASEGIGTGEAVLDWRKMLHWKDRSRKGIVLLRDRPDSFEWEGLLRHAAGIVTFIDPGSHFYARAAEAGVPVISKVRSVSGRLDRIRPGDSLWLDASRLDGFVTDRELREKSGAVALYLADRLAPGEVSGRRASEQVAYVQSFRRLAGQEQPYDDYVRSFHEEFPREDPVVAANYTLRHDRIHLSETFMDWIVSLGWGTQEWREESHYTFDEKGLAFLRELYRRVPDRAAHDMNDTTFGGHSVAVSFYKALEPEQQSDLMNRMAAEILSEKRKPGWAGGIFLLSRYVSKLAEAGDEAAVAVLNRLSAVTLGRILEEFFHFTGLVEGWSQNDGHPCRETLLGYIDGRYAGSQGRGLYADNMRYLAETLHRYPALAPAKWVAFVRRMDPGRLREALGQETMPAVVREWFDDQARVDTPVPPVPEVAPAPRAPTAPVVRLRAEPFDDYRRQYQKDFPREDPVAAAAYTLRHDRISLCEWHLDWLVDVGWATSKWLEESHYTFNENGLAYLREIFRQSPDWASRGMNETTFGGHSVAVSFFKALEAGQQSDLMNRMAEEILAGGYKPGWAGGIFLLSRLVSVLAEARSEEPPVVLNGLTAVTLRRIIEEFFHLTGLHEDWIQKDAHPYRGQLMTYVGDRYPASNLGRRAAYDDGQYLNGVYDRFPALEAATWIGYVSRMDAGKLQAALEDPRMPEAVRTWFESIRSTLKS